MKIIMITNNPLVQNELSKEVDIQFHEVEYIKVLELARDYIHKGYKLLTHPLSGSVKPNETPYKSVIVEKRDSSQVDMDSLMIIEQSMDTTKRFITNKKTPEWNARIKEDFQVIDLSLIKNVLDRLM